MPSSLTPSESSLYNTQGFLSPLRVFSATEAAALFAKYESTETQHGKFEGRRNQKPHLLFPWIHDIVTNKAILDAVEGVLGPDILAYSAQFFSKENDGTFVSWHQDATYWGLTSPDVCTAWVALTPSVKESGCMQVIASTHHTQLPHIDKYDPLNMLTRGQEILVDISNHQPISLELQPGEMSLHHVLLWHGSEANRADYPRIGLAIRYIKPSVGVIEGYRGSATLVRGTDKYGYHDHEVRPESDLDPEAVKRHEGIIERQLKILYRGATQAGKHGMPVVAAKASM